MTWIPVAERLPKHSTPVIGYDAFYDRIGEAKLVEWGERNHLVFIDSDDCHITHWMPFPKRPNDDYCGVPLIETERRRMTND